MAAGEEQPTGLGAGSVGPVASGGSTPAAGSSQTQATADLNVVETIPLVCPRQVREDVPLSDAARQCVLSGRQSIQRILSGEDRRLLIVIGPCSIHDQEAAFEYAQRLREVGSQVADQLYVVMRVYFEKPRTTIGWKGLLYDPYLNDSFDMQEGITRARRIMLRITEMGLPTAAEMLDPIVPQYIADLVAWASIGARTTESQTHRQLASGLSMPVGFKNSTEGNLQVAIEAMQSARHAHSFLGIDVNGRTAIVHTRGNPWGHLILRGGRSGPNYHDVEVAQAVEALRKASLPPVLMVDCSHANSSKQFRNQQVVWQDVVQQACKADTPLIGMMVESNLFEGNQPFSSDTAKLRYGVSLTDACIGWETTREMLLTGAEQLRKAAR